MSLLLEALKKAEKAKEEAQRRARGGADPASAPSAFDPESTVLEEGRPVTTRDQLPDISSPLEILSDDLRPLPAPKSAPVELSLADEPPPAREPKPSAKREAAAASKTSGAERATAQRVFEAKFKEPNPRLPFFITVGLLSVFAISTVVYFWIQLRPPAPLVNTNPSRPPDEKQVEVAAQPPAGLPNSANPAPAAATAIPGLPGVPAAPAGVVPAAPVPAASASAPIAATPAAPAQPAAVAPAAPTAAPSAAPSSRPAAPRERAPSTRNDERPVSINRPGPQINPQVAAGYAAYQAGDLVKARAEYQQALRDESSNRDALLGLAAVEMRAQRYDAADGYYQRVLQADPRDAHAQAGMVSIRGQQLDPVQVESRVKSLLATDRNSTVLQFTLANQYAQQGRWAEAQQAYFKAFAADPDNPDFAFNLAVSLDQLHQSKLALEYYRRALTLSEKRSAGFSAEIARTRVQQLSR